MNIRHLAAKAATSLVMISVFTPVSGTNPIQVSAIAYQNNGTILAIARATNVRTCGLGTTSSVEFYDWQLDASLYSLDTSPCANIDLDWNADDVYIASVTPSSNTIKVWSYDSLLNVVSEVQTSYRPSVTANRVAWRPGSDVYVYSDFVSPVVSGIGWQEYIVLEAPADYVDWSSDGNVLLYSSSSSQVIGTALVTSSLQMRVINEMRGEYVFWATWSPTLDLIANISQLGEEQKIQIRNPGNLGVMNDILAQSGVLLRLAWHPTDPVLASFSTGGYIQIWNVQTGALITSIEAGRTVVAADWRPDGAVLTYGAPDGQIVHFDFTPFLDGTEEPTPTTIVTPAPTATPGQRPS